MKTLAQSIIEILDVKANKGIENGRFWDNYRNGEGVDFGKDIERLIKKAKKEMKK